MERHDTSNREGLQCIQYMCNSVKEKANMKDLFLSLHVKTVQVGSKPTCHDEEPEQQQNKLINYNAFNCLNRYINFK